MMPDPPRRQPHWIAIEEGWSTDPSDCARLAVEAICDAARPPNTWSFDGAPIVVSEVVVTAAQGRVTGACAGAIFALGLTARSDGWVEGVMTVDGREWFRFFLERSYEEFEFYPPGHSGAASPGDAQLDAPGRIGKRLSWAQIHAPDWPTLGRAGWLTVESG